MKISKILNKEGRRLSFEVFPPKTDAAFDSISGQAEKIAELSPSYMSVTYGAGGGSSRFTIDIARNIKNGFGIPVLTHLTCVSSTRATVREKIGQIRQAGIENIMALRGDIPADLKDADRSGWDYRYAAELVREIREAGDFCIGGACYPEVHPESKSPEDDIRYLRQKVDAGCSFLTTQMFFDNDLFYRFVDRALGAGINVPVVPGVMPITRAVQVERAINLSGSYMPPEFMEIYNRFGSSDEDMMKAGIDYATRQIAHLLSQGVRNVHVYTMNKPEVASAIKNNLLDLLTDE